ncbi:MAG TPA: FtsX-like permease family protein [Galbitalea sp.]|nr:FtsX-like permease family protein [Galbitalea sp.]
MLWRIARGGVVSSWRLLIFVLLVATLSATTVASLGLLVVATEQAGVRSALSRLPTSQSAVDVDLQQPTGSVAETTSTVSKAIRRVLGSGIAATSGSRSFTMPNATSVGGAIADVSYFAELAAVRSHVTLLSGTWPKRTAQSASAIIPVIVPSSGAEAVQLQIGDTFSVQLDVTGDLRTARVVGAYTAADPKAKYWGEDPLHGAGVNRDYPSPANGADTTTEFGPLLVASGQLDASAVPIDAMQLSFAPKFDKLMVGQLAPLVKRLKSAKSEVPSRLRNEAQQVTFTSTLGSSLSQVVSKLIVTRSAVIVIMLLLLVLAIAALGQAARLFSDAQAGGRALMLARGASRPQVFGLSAIEAAAIGLLTAVLSPVLARFAYGLLALLPSMRAAGMPKDAGMPSLSWELALAVAFLFVVILVAPLLARPTTFVDGEQDKVRGGWGSGLVRSGVDFGVVVIAAVLYWQLLSYRTPVGGGETPGIDPVLVAAPVAVLLATGLLSVRLIPAVSRLADRGAARSRGSVFPLAEWGVGRRSRQSSAAVLLLTLAVAVGAFGQSFLATWQQSQVDQASLAVGPPVRVPATAASIGRQSAALMAGAVGKPQPVIRRSGSVVDASGQDTDNVTTVLGLTASARRLLATGRNGALGGDKVAKLPVHAEPGDAGIALPGDVRGVQGIVRVEALGAPVPGISINLAALIEDANGLLTTIQLGSVPVDGEPHAVRGLLNSSARGPAPLKFVGFESSVTVGDRSAYGVGNAQANANILLGRLAVLHPTDEPGHYAAEPLTVGRRLPWFAEKIYGAPPTDDPSSGTAPSGWQMRLTVVIPAEVSQQGAAYLLEDWKPIVAVPAVVTSALAKSVGVRLHDSIPLDISGALVEVNIVGIVQLIPGVADFAALSVAAASGVGAAASDGVVVDQAELQRVLVQGGESGVMVDEWWINVPTGRGAAFLTSHPTAARGGVSREVLAQQLQGDPLRVATQAALWLSIVAAALLVAMGFAIHTAASMRARRLEFAQLRAIGLSRRALVGVIGAESVILCVIGTVFGIVIGLLLSWLISPLVTLSPDGSPAVPAVAIVVPIVGVALLILEVLVVLACVVLAVAVTQRSTSPAQILRGAEE